MRGKGSAWWLTALHMVKHCDNIVLLVFCGVNCPSFFLVKTRFLSGDMSPTESGQFPAAELRNVLIRCDLGSLGDWDEMAVSPRKVVPATPSTSCGVCPWRFSSYPPANARLFPSYYHQLTNTNRHDLLAESFLFSPKHTRIKLEPPPPIPFLFLSGGRTPPHTTAHHPFAQHTTQHSRRPASTTRSSRQDGERHDLPVGREAGTAQGRVAS